MKRSECDLFIGMLIYVFLINVSQKGNPYYQTVPFNAANILNPCIKCNLTVSILIQTLPVPGYGLKQFFLQLPYIPSNAIFLHFGTRYNQFYVLDALKVMWEPGPVSKVSIPFLKS